MKTMKDGLLIFGLCLISSIAIAAQNEVERTNEPADKRAVEEGKSPHLLQQTVASAPIQHSITEQQKTELQADIQSIRDEQEQLATRLNQWFASAEGIEEKIMEIGTSTFDLSNSISSNFLTMLGLIFAFIGLFGYGGFLAMRKEIVTNATDLVRKQHDELRDKSNQLFDEATKKSNEQFVEATLKSDKHLAASVEMIEKLIDEETRKTQERTLIRLYTALSDDNWKKYDVMEPSLDVIEYKRVVSAAVETAQSAFFHAKKLNTISENKYAVIHAQNNLVYHLSSMYAIDGDHVDERVRILRMAREVADFADEYRSKYTAWFHFTETCIYSSILIGGDNDKLLGLAALRSLLEDDTINIEWRKSIAKKYKAELVTQDTKNPESNDSK